jgi:hypothetical protein
LVKLVFNDLWSCIAALHESVSDPKRTFPFLKIEAEDSALAAADLLDCFNQSRIIHCPPGGPKNVRALCFRDRRGAGKLLKLDKRHSWMQCASKSKDSRWDDADGEVVQT